MKINKKRMRYILPNIGSNIESATVLDDVVANASAKPSP